MILVPYDCGPNHGPSLQAGKKAHWALITGVVVVCQDTHDFMKNGGKSQESTQTIILEDCVEDKIFLKEVSSRKQNHVYVVARQSKSVVLGIWSVDDLVDSNMNLKTIDITRDEGCYVVGL